MASDWFVIREGKELGPYTGPQLKQMAATGALRPADPVRRADMKVPRPAGEIKSLFPGPAPATGSTTSVTPSAMPPAGEPDVPTGTPAPLWGHPAVLVASLVICFPLGLLLVWLRPGWSVPRRLAWTGGTLAVWVPLIVLNRIDAGRAKDDLAAAHAAWGAGDRGVAAAKYRELLAGTGKVFLTAADNATVYGRLIDSEAEGGNEPEVRRLVEEAEKKGVNPAANSPAGRQAVADRRSEVARVEAEKKERAAAEERERLAKAEADKKERDAKKEKAGKAAPRVGKRQVFANETAARDLILGKTPDEVIAAIGKPDHVNQGGKFTNGQEYDESWDYDRCVTHPATSRKQDLKVFFRNGRVVETGVR